MHSKKRELLNYLLLIIIYIKKIFYKNYVFIVGTPIHGNIGDQAILYSEIKYFKEKFNVKVIAVESYLMKSKFHYIKKIIGSNTIYVHGGGFLGTLWLEEEEMFRTILKEFKDNKIVVLPQTAFFDDDDILQESIKIYSSHKNLTIFLREKYSFEYMKKNFPNCNLKIVPDIVLYNTPLEYNNKRKDVLLCFRNDKEKKFNSLNTICSFLERKKIFYTKTDTIVKKKVFDFNRKKIIRKKLLQFSKYKLLITDRLHGMVFAYITKTPCLVFENKSYKVKGLYEWIKECNYIKICNDNNIESAIESLLKIDGLKTCDLQTKFDDLDETILKNLN